MKQTAVEQFIEQLEQQGNSWENASIGRMNISIKIEDYLKLIEQAKEMEKEQIIEAYIEASPRLEDITKESAEQYYYETFKSE
jgi:HEPN domain-containing protein